MPIVQEPSVFLATRLGGGRGDRVLVLRGPPLRRCEWVVARRRADMAPELCRVGRTSDGAVELLPIGGNRAEQCGATVVPAAAVVGTLLLRWQCDEDPPAGSARVG